MKVQEIDFSQVALDLSDDGLAYTPSMPENLQLSADILEVLSSGTGLAGEVGVVIAATPVRTEQRDLAQAMLDVTDFDTVIVRTPTGGGAVSEVLTRAQIEAAEPALVYDEDFSGGIERFIAEINGGAGAYSWLAIAAAIAIAVVLLVGATLLSLRSWCPFRSTNVNT